VGEVVAAIETCWPVIDLGDGLGTFGFALAGSVSVHMVEGNKPAFSASARAAYDLPVVSVAGRDLAHKPIKRGGREPRGALRLVFRHGWAPAPCDIAVLLLRWSGQSGDGFICWSSAASRAPTRC
jgi:hypothetical protein